MAFIGLLAGFFWIGPGVLPGPFSPPGQRPPSRSSSTAIPVWRSSGYDPVAYFTDALAEPGLPDFEASEAGAVWRFRNEGNRAFFLAHPEIYGPQFGGYDPTDLARGVTVAGNPRVWLIAGQRLYLFGREENRDAFAADPAHLLREANARWPRLQETLAR